MDLVDKYVEEVETIKELIKPIVDEYYPSKADRGVISLYSLITVGILAHLHFKWSYKARLCLFYRRSKVIPGGQIQQASAETID